MPIPTRSASLREPRPPVSNLARPTTGAAKPPPRATDKPRSSTIPSTADPSSTKDNGTSNRGRTLLPQRSNPSRDDSHGLGHVRLQPESQLLRRGEVSPKRVQQNTSSTGKSEPPVTGRTGGPVPTRRQSLMRPGGSKLASTRGDVSASSKATAPNWAPPSPRKQSTLRSTTQASSERPPSPKKPDMPPPPRPGRSASLRQPAGAGPGSTAAPRGHARHRSQVVPTSSKTVQPDATAASQRARPQFSSYQQHYSPKKSNKPPTPTPNDVPTPANLNVPASWPDVAALQTELLQLSLFHSSSLRRQTEWRSESEARLRTKYDAVAGQYRSLLVDEKSRQRTMNAQALACWIQNCDEHRGPHGFPEQIQILSQVLQEVSDLITSGTNGRYSCAVATFDRWLQHADHVRFTRESSDATHEMPFLDPLEPSWQEELHALQAKLELGARQLHTLDILGFGEAERIEQSALARITHGLKESMHLMVQEIQAMRALEAELVQCERETVRGLATHVTSDLHVRRETRGAWNEA